MIFIPFCLSAGQNRTNRVDFSSSIVLGNRLIELTKTFQFDSARLPNQSNNKLTDWVSLILSFVRLATPGKIHENQFERNFIIAID